MVKNALLNFLLADIKAMDSKAKMKKAVILSSRELKTETGIKEYLKNENI